MPLNHWGIIEPIRIKLFNPATGQFAAFSDINTATDVRISRDGGPHALIPAAELSAGGSQGELLWTPPSRASKQYLTAVIDVQDADGDAFASVSLLLDQRSRDGVHTGRLGVVTSQTNFQIAYAEQNAADELVGSYLKVKRIGGGFEKRVIVDTNGNGVIIDRTFTQAMVENDPITLFFGDGVRPQPANVVEFNGEAAAGIGSEADPIRTVNTP